MTTQPLTASASPKIGNSSALKAKQSTSKSELALRALKRKSGATMEELSKLTGWQAHSVRGFLSGTVRKKLGHEVVRQTDDKGVARYSISKRGSAS